MDLPKIIGPARLSDFPEHAILIAEIIGGWSSLEDRLAEFLLLFASPDPWHAHLIMANVLSGKTKLEMIRTAGTFALKTTPQRLKELHALFNRLQARLDARNLYAHGVYVVSDQNELCIFRRKFEIGNTKNVIIVRLTDLKTEVENSATLRVDVAQFHDAVLSEFPEGLAEALLKIWARACASLTGLSVGLVVDDLASGNS